MGAAPVTKQVKLRYAGICRECHVDLGKGVEAIYDRVAKNVICLDCWVRTAAPAVPDPALEAAPEPSHPVDDAPVEPGSAGASARREYERRAAK